MNLQALARRILQAWSQPPTGKRLAATAAILIGYVVLDSIGATVVAALTGYHGSVSQLFALSMTAGYNPSTVAAVLTTLGPAGRQADASLLVLFDLVFPLVYAIALSTGLRLVLVRNRAPRIAAVAGAIPFVAAAANWLADVAIVAMIRLYPDVPAGLAVAASALTTVKLLVIAASAIAIGVGAVVAFARQAASSASPAPALRPPAVGIERTLIAAGVIGPILFNAIYLLQGMIRPGYNALTMPVSALSLTADGWLQVANFVLFGLLIVAFAIGLSRLMNPGPGRTWATVLQLLIGVGLILAGVFVQDPGQGYPVGAAIPAHPSGHALAHLVATIAVFNARIVWSLIMAVRFNRDSAWRSYSGFSVLTAVALMVFLGAFGAALSNGGPAGLFERLGTLSTSSLTLAIALRLLIQSETRSPARPSLTAAATEIAGLIR